MTGIYDQGRLDTDYSEITGIISHWKMDALNPRDEIGSNDGTSINMDSSNILNDINNGTSVNMDASNRRNDINDGTSVNMDIDNKECSDD